MARPSHATRNPDGTDVEPDEQSQQGSGAPQRDDADEASNADELPERPGARIEEEREQRQGNDARGDVMGIGGGEVAVLSERLQDYDKG